GEVGLAYAGWANEQDVGLFELDILFSGGTDALVMVVDGDGEDLLGLLLADDVFIQAVEDVLRRRDALASGGSTLGGGGSGVGTGLLIDDFAAQVHAFIADVDGAGPSNEPANLILVLAAERTVILNPISAVPCQSALP